MSPPRDFIKDAKDAAPWEKRVSEKITYFLRNYMLRRLLYDTSEGKKLQKKGIDFIVESEKSKHEIKIRDNKWYLKGLLLETMSVVESNILGWLYTSEADAIGYVWKNKDETNCMPIGYLILLKELRKTQWYNKLPGSYHVFNPKPGSYRDTPNGRIYWTTKFIVPPIKDFPKGIVWKFNAILPSNVKQTFLPVGEGRE